MSRNDLFSTSWSTVPPPPSTPPPLNIRCLVKSTLTPSASPSPSTLSRSSSRHRRPPPIHVSEKRDGPLSPLHQSPSLAPIDAWKPPLPPFENVEVRLIPSETYLLGEGRYGRVYLASYRKSKGKGRAIDQVNDAGDGFVGGSWRLCAAKRMAPDRESQTMGLREAFFLNRLKGGVGVIKLCGVKEDVERRHGRSVSDTRPREDAQQVTLSRLTLLLEHAPLGTLDRLLRTSPALVTREMFAKWAKQTTDAIAWIHSKGVVHADVKPANLLLTSTLDLRLSDFGSSLLVHPAHPPVDGVGLGTLPFSAPELVDPNRSFSFPVDIFALGASLYQCLTGREPYRGLRTMEMLHYVKKGSLWAYEERRGPKEDMVGTPSTPGSLSPFPSAWRDEPLRRGGSLRLRPRISRMPSAESLRASDDIVAATNEASGVKLWAKWANHAPAAGSAEGGAVDVVSALLAEDDPITPVDAAPFETPDVTSPATPISGRFRERQTYLGPEADGELVEVDQRLLDTLREMLDPDEAERPTAEELLEMW